MTAVNIAVQGKRAYMAVDRACTLATGEIRWIDSKIIAGQAFPFALASTGNLNPHALTRHLNDRAPRNPRALVAAIADLMPVMFEEAKGEGEHDPRLCVFGIVWSARTNRPAAFVVGDGRWEQFPAFEPTYVSWVMGSDGTASEALGRAVDLTDPDSFDPCADGVSLMDWQRRNCTFEIGGNHVPAIGGGIDLATISREGLEITQIHAWADEVGKTIKPFG